MNDRDDNAALARAKEVVVRVTLANGAGYGLCAGLKGEPVFRAAAEVKASR